LTADRQCAITFSNGDVFNGAGIGFFGYFESHVYLLMFNDGYELEGIKVETV
jgi:hypothetical protein